MGVNSNYGTIRSDNAHVCTAAVDRSGCPQKQQVACTPQVQLESHVVQHASARNFPARRVIVGPAVPPELRALKCASGALSCPDT